MTLHADRAALAQRYARPLFEQAMQEDALDATLDDLRLLRALDERLPELGRFLSHPTTPRTEKLALLDAELAPRLSPLTAQLTRVLAGNDRMAILPDVADAFEALAAQARQEGEALVISAEPLSEEQRGRLEAAICRRWGFQRVTLRVQDDPSLLGGVVVRVGDSVVDGSFSAKLAQLEKTAL